MASEPEMHGVIGPQTPVSTIDRAIARLAERQHGVVGRGQPLELGIGPGAIRHRVRCGRLHVKHPGVYAVGHRILSQRGRWMVAVLASPGAVLSHRSAGALWGILAVDGVPDVPVSVWRPQRRGLHIHASLLAR